MESDILNFEVSLTKVHLFKHMTNYQDQSFFFF